MEPTRVLTSSDGVRLAVYEQGDPAAPVILAIHGYPDNASVWDGVAGELADRFRVVRYDVRGTGASSKPAGRAHYRLDRLEDDVATVIDALSPDRAVHLLAHDWGSVQAWHAVTGARLAGRFASFTSISGPCLDQIGPWLRRNLNRSGFAKVLRQVLDSYYLVVFKLPGLAELAWRTGLIEAALGRAGRPAEGSRPDARARPDYRRSWPDKAHGLQLYRANLLTRYRPAGGPRRATDVPVQVLAPSADPFVSRAVQLEAPRPYLSNFYPREVRGGHWVVLDRPTLIATMTAQLVEFVEYARHSPELASARRTS
ncbi:MAG: alpha/beta fold hydrolase [Jatrophihabitans sp.]